MIIVLQLAGVVAALIGVVALYYGIPVKEFSFGNTLILVGTVSLCTGAILFALSVVALELRQAARRLAGGLPAPDSRAKTSLPPFSSSAGVPADDGSPTFDQPRPAPVQVEASRVPDVDPFEPAQAAPSPPPKPKRNLLFQSNMRRDRERAEARLAETAQQFPTDSDEMQSTNFEDTWPRPDRARGGEALSSRRTGRRLATPAEANEPDVTPPPPSDEPSAVTVLKSGVVDGMAYSLYSDGSIEAQMPEGVMRFASIDDLRAHLDHRP